MGVETKKEEDTLGTFSTRVRERESAILLDTFIVRCFRPEFTNRTNAYREISYRRFPAM